LNFIITIFYIVPHRGDDFRVAFSTIGDVRSLIPDNVHIIALTATVTTNSFCIITERLSLKDPVVVGVKPNQPNIKYFVEPLPAVEVLCDTLRTGLKNLRLTFPKTLVFCRSLGDCSTLYQAIRRKMGDDFTEPPKYPDLHCFRLVDMFTRACNKKMKEKNSHFISS